MQTTLDFSGVTERPGQAASSLQLRMLTARYAWAARFARDAHVLEVACGAGMGLSVLADAAASVTAGDVDESNLAEARAVHGSDPRITLRQIDAVELPYQAESFDVVLLFEALYYVPDAQAFFAEAERVLRPGGVLLIASVNPQWTGFNPSPFSVHYHTADGLREALSEAGLQSYVSAGFPEASSARHSLTAAVRRLAVKLRLIPRTMSGKRFLKRLFYGKLDRIPDRLRASALPDQMTPVGQLPDLSRHRVLYAAAQKV